MSESKGTLNSLLKYRFTKRPASKLSHFEAKDQVESNCLSRDNSIDSQDSQATIPYASQHSFNLSQNGSQESLDSQATLPMSQSTVPWTNSANSSNSSEQPTQSNCSAASPGPPVSPVFTSKTKSQMPGCIVVNNHSPVPCTKFEDGSLKSKKTGIAQLNGSSNTKFRKVIRPDPDTSDEECPKEPPFKSQVLTVNKTFLERLREMFPGGSENRMRAALIVYPRDFDKAVQFMQSEPVVKKTEKCAVRSRDDSDSDELPEITTNRKRIKLMSRSPSPPKILSVYSLSEPKPETTLPAGKSNQGALQFLQECFPAKSMQHLQSVLASNNGDAELAVAALSNEDSDDAVLAKTLSQNEAAGPSSGVKNSSTVPPGFIGKDNVPKTFSAVKQNVKVAKVKRKDVDLSDEDDDYDNESGADSSDSADSEDFDNRTKSDTDNFLQFFEETTLDELSAMPGCSKKKAEVIISLRPFKTWENLHDKFSTVKGLSVALISGCKEIMQVRNAIRRLMVRCENISQQMGAVVSRLMSRQGGRAINDQDQIVKQPELLNQEFSLQPYQLIGLSWLRIMHEQQLNGILADEMGLGKTIQAIAFIAHLMEEGEEGPHVIIVPSSTIENWLRELQRWCPMLKVVVYYGSPEERRAVRHSIFYQQEEFNVLLTTYNMATGGVEDRVLFKKFDFHYAVFDEGHMLKNMSSLRFQNLMKISADRRLLLTGTPLQNNLLELMSLLCFVMPEIFQGKTEHLKKVFAMITRSDEKQKSRFERDRIAQAKRIMKPFVLRRLKRDVLKQLPRKTEHIRRCTMTEGQLELYDDLLARYSQEVADDENSACGSIGIFMQFRKAANHPLLLRHRYTDDKIKEMAKKISKEPSHRDRGALPNLIQEDMSVMNDFELFNLCKQYKKYLGKYVLEASVIGNSAKIKALDAMLPQMKEKNDRVLLFSQFTMVLDILEVYLQQKDYKYLRLDGQTPVPDRLQLIDRFSSEPDIFVFLLSTRAGGLGINLTAANTIILHDIDFNPYNDKQAEDRCHRLGQQREVTIYKLICQDTVDEAMLRCANDKLALEKDLTGSNNDDSEENIKDVANILKEVFKSRQKEKGDLASNGVQTDKSNGNTSSSEKS